MLKKLDHDVNTYALREKDRTYFTWMELANSDND